MNKTVSITLNGLVFTLEEDAYYSLKKYLEGIEAHFSNEEERKEIIADIEASIAEKFALKIKANKKVITKMDVDELIKILGSIEDITQDESKIDDSSEENHSASSDQGKEEAPEGPRVEKKLYRDTDDVIIAGVCSGIATYFEVDPVFIRLLFVVSIFFGGFGIILYLILWIVMPAAKTSAQKLEMQGDALTLKKIEKIVKEKSLELKTAAEKPETKKALQVPILFMREVLQAIANFFKSLVPIISKIIGFFIILSSLFGIATFSFFAAVMLFSKNTINFNTDLPLESMFNLPEYMSLVLSGYLAIVLPIFFALLIGVAFMKVKNIFSFALTMIFVSIWIVSSIVFGVIVVDVSPKVQEAVKIQDEAERITREIDIKDFDRLYTSGNHNIKIQKGDYYTIRAEGRPQDIDRLEMNLDNGVLRITNRDVNGFCFLCYLREVDLFVTMPELKALTLRGTSDVDASGFYTNDFRIDMRGTTEANLDIDTSNLLIDLDGVAKLNLLGTSSSITAVVESLANLNLDKLNTSYLNIEADDSAKVYLSGKSEELVLKTSEISRVYAFPLLVNKARVEARHGSRVEINVASLLDVESEGYSRVTYKGEPQVKKDIKGDSNLEKIFSFTDIEKSLETETEIATGSEDVLE